MIDFAVILLIAFPKCLWNVVDKINLKHRKTSNFWSSEWHKNSSVCCMNRFNGPDAIVTLSTYLMDVRDNMIQEQEYQSLDGIFEITLAQT